MIFTGRTAMLLFSVAQKGVNKVKAYIANQHNHHKRHDFKEELRVALDKNHIKYDERYVWD